MVRAATCSQKGEERGTCTVCGKTVTETIPMLDHKFGTWTVTTQPTCTKAGQQSATCTVCGKATTKSVDKLEHTYGAFEVVTAPTCTKEGKQTRKCTMCGAADSTAMEKIPHTVAEWKITREATESRKGVRKGTCSVCGRSVSEEFDKYPGRSGFKKSRDYGSKFEDVSNDKWFGKYVETAYEYALANGTSDKRFSPDEKFTVAQALTAAVNIRRAYFGDDIDSTDTNAAWYTPYVNYCIQNGIIKEGQFENYNQNIKRGEMAEIFAAVLPAEEYESVRSGSPADMTTNLHSYDAVAKLYHAGIVSGDAKTGNYRPDDEIVRSEACVIFTRIAVQSERVK